MFVKSVMVPHYKVIKVQSSTNLSEVLHLLNMHQIDGMPVTDGNTYKGIITKYAIYEASFHSLLPQSEFLQQTKAEEVAFQKNDTLSEDTIFEKTFIMMKKAPLAAVTDESKNMLGIVTRYEVLEQFQSAFGMNKKGVRISFTSIETEGRIARLSEITRQFHENIISLATFDETDKLVRRIVMKVEKKQNMERFLRKLKEAGFRILSIHE